MDGHIVRSITSPVILAAPALLSGSESSLPPFTEKDQGPPLSVYSRHGGRSASARRPGRCAREMPKTICNEDD